MGESVLPAPETSVRRTVLDNGIRVLTECVPTVRSVSLGVWVRAGSRDESPGEAGISHFLEHVVFKGTETRSALEIAQALESVGGSLDAFTSREHTTFLARVLDEDLPRALEVVSDLLRKPLLLPSHIELEKQVVIEEIRSLEDLPEELAHEAFARTVWHDHPLRNSVLGTEATVSSFTAEGLRAYLEGSHTPGRTIVAAAGRLEHDEVVRRVEECMGSLDRRARAELEIEPEPFRPVTLTPRDVTQEHIYIGARGVAYAHPDRCALLLLAGILGGGMSSRLYQSVREQAGLAYAISSYAEFLTDSGLFDTYVAVAPAHTAPAVGLIFEEIRRVDREGVSEAELESAKAQTIGGLIIGLESVTHRMTRLATAEDYGRPVEDLDTMIGDIRRVTREDVVRVLGETLRPGRLCLVGMGPAAEDALSGLEIAL